MTNSKSLKKNCKNNFLAYIAPSSLQDLLITEFHPIIENKCAHPFFL